MHGWQSHSLMDRKVVEPLSLWVSLSLSLSLSPSLPLSLSPSLPLSLSPSPSLPLSLSPSLLSLSLSISISISTSISISISIPIFINGLTPRCRRPPFKGVSLCSHLIGGPSTQNSTRTRQNTKKPIRIPPEIRQDSTRNRSQGQQMAMEANGRLQRSNNKCLWPECLVEAAARDFRGLKAGKQQAWTR